MNFLQLLMPPGNLSSISSSDASCSPLLLLSAPRSIHFLKEIAPPCVSLLRWKASKTSPRNIHTVFHAGLRTAGGAKRVAEIGYPEERGRPETATHETEAKSNNTGARPVTRDVHWAGESCEGQGVSGPPEGPAQGMRERCQTFGLAFDVLKKLENEERGWWEERSGP